ncbi:MAG: DNA-binding response regulator [Anaerocolumna sp.]|nr:DNA-binding response regulator [Anaerocolumna sp.]
MLKIFLVEDEIIVREGIKNNINWNENGFIFCGEASDGELAYPMIQNLRPDIVITDIKMPFMDGITLSRLIKKEFPNIKIIFLSGYSEFEYAKDAIQIGITEYLLKPINSTNLLNCIKRVRENIQRELDERENLNKYRREMTEYIAEEKRKLFIEIIQGTSSYIEIMDKSKSLNIELSALMYNIILLKINRNQNTDGVKLLGEIIKKIEAFLEEKPEVIPFDCAIDGISLLLKGDSEEDIIQTQNYCVKNIKDIICGYKTTAYFGGIGRPVKRFGEIPLSYHEASKALAYRYIWDFNEILNSKDINSSSMVVPTSMEPDMTNIVLPDKKKVLAFLKTGEYDDVSFFVQEYFKRMGKEGNRSIVLRQYILIDMYVIVTGYLDELGYKTDVIPKPFNNIGQMNMRLSGLEDIIVYIEAIFKQAISIRDELWSQNMNVVIHKAKEYVNENYCNEDISLNIVAASVYISPSHLSTIFSQKTGQTFIKYLTDLRMNKAKELLKSTNMRTSEVGYQVGFRDPH